MKRTQKAPARSPKSSTGTNAARAAKPRTAAAKPAAKRATAPKQPTMKKFGPRADLGAPIAGFFAKQPPPLRAILEELRDLIEEAAPDADSGLKWGMPFFTIGGTMMCALAGHKAHVNLILSGTPGAYADPDGLLTGEGKTGRHLKLLPGAEIPRKAVRGWLATAAKLARAK